MPQNRVSGILYVRVDGVLRDSIGNWTWNLGPDKREAVRSTNRTVGYKSVPQTPFIEGEITDERTLDVAALQALENATITLEHANGKTVVLRNAWYAADGNVQTEAANIQVRFEGLSAEEV